MVDFKTLKSDTILAAAYEDGQLYLRHWDGRVIKWCDVSPDIHREIVNSDTPAEVAYLRLDGHDHEVIRPSN